MRPNPEPFNFAIVGAGMVARYHLEAIRANADLGARLAAVVHYDRERFASLAQAFGAPCMRMDEMLERTDVDAVCLCTPSGQHAEQAVAAAQAGKHVLVEKPLALSAADADRIIAACDEAGVKLGVVLQRRAEPLFQEVYEAVTGGTFGSLTLGVVTMPYYRGQAYYDSGAWRGTWALDGGGVLMNQGIHIIDLLLWYLGDPVDVQAHAATLHRSVEVEDVAAATLRFANGALATISATTTTEPGFPHRLELYGTKGGIQIEGESVIRRLPADALAPAEPRAAEAAGSGGDPKGIKVSGHTGIVRDFVQAVREDRRPLCDGREGRRSLATVLAIYEAAGLPCPWI